MATLIPRRRKRPSLTRRRPRRPNPNQVVNRVGLHELTPELPRFLGQAAYLQLSFFEHLSRAVTASPTTASKEVVSRVAGIALARHQSFVTELKRLGLNPSEEMEPFVIPIDAFHLRTQGSDWSEALLAYYVESGILDDGFLSIAGGFDDEETERIAKVLSDDEPRRLIAAELSAAIGENPRLASRLALYGRRLVGDVLLLARSALDLPENTAPDDERLEPVLTELIADHTRRMDELGLTA
ncbi:MAG TPA: ferritin-like fold-containing protein [Terrimesophilobacter sp.]|nr:ferritin-like fold-containing protein [Terrimesophilobacter sp.]